MRYADIIPAANAGTLGAIYALLWHRERVVGLLLLTTTLYVLFFERLVWLNYTTLEVRFLMYPGLPLLVFASLACSTAFQGASKISRHGASVGLALGMVGLCVMSYQQGDAGMRFIYNSQSSMREMAEELANILGAAEGPSNRPRALAPSTKASSTAGWVRR